MRRAVEVKQPDRYLGGKHGKTDVVDAEIAARARLSGRVEFPSKSGEGLAADRAEDEALGLASARADRRSRERLWAPLRRTGPGQLSGSVLDNWGVPVSVGAT